MDRVTQYNKTSTIYYILILLGFVFYVIFFQNTFAIFGPQKDWGKKKL